MSHRALVRHFLLVAIVSLVTVGLLGCGGTKIKDYDDAEATVPLYPPSGGAPSASNSPDTAQSAPSGATVSTPADANTQPQQVREGNNAPPTQAGQPLPARSKEFD